jgi:pyrroline-5-carboxylate reductase
VRQAQFCQPLLLSPRGRAAELHAQKPLLTAVATDNQTVLDGSDTIVLGLTPQDARTALEPLRFRREQRVISLMHGVSPEAICSLPRSPPGSVTRVNPLPAVAHRQGVAAMAPHDPPVACLFGLLGAVHEVATLEELHTLHAASAVMGPIYEMQASMARWLCEHGASDPVAARRYVADLFFAIAADAREPPKSCDFARLVAEQTPGGLNEQNVGRLRAAGLFRALPNALDETLRVLREANARTPDGEPPK